ncbi:MAG: hypothetical protein F6K56_40895 [Moorea sp. SIO3G5]|nr:hypothetical protein [Moorena sp. SIO3G5]
MLHGNIASVAGTAFPPVYPKRTYSINCSTCFALLPTPCSLKTLPN